MANPIPPAATLPPCGDLPEHTRPNVSRLEAFRAVVALARRRNWPYRAVAALLRERHGLAISARAIGYFCRCRGILKGVGETRRARPGQGAPPALPASAPAAPPRRKPRRDREPFVYREGPLKTRANGLLDDD